MEREGVRIVSTSRDSEFEQIAALGRFDAVLAAAVIEHVPHTPRHLLETLFSTVRPGGLLLLDTPNVARYWNRRALERGDTIFQPIEDQYMAEPPWEGHHREYTASELGWMLERVGCEAVEVEFLDYNMLQFDEFSADHTECLAAIVEDPSQSDTLLVAGRRRSIRSPIDQISRRRSFADVARRASARVARHVLFLTMSHRSWTPRCSSSSPTRIPRRRPTLSRSSGSSPGRIRAAGSPARRWCIRTGGRRPRAAASRPCEARSSAVRRCVAR
jgi:Methyltransferase domain